MSDATPADLHRILDRQRAAFLRAGPPDLKQRRADLRRLKAEILKRRTEIVCALKTDFGQRSERESAIVELIPLVQSINYMIAHVGHWMKPERRHVSALFPVRSCLGGPATGGCRGHYRAVELSGLTGSCAASDCNRRR